MLKFFRTNDPYRLVVIFLILIALRIVQSHYIAGQSMLELKWLLLGEWLGNGFVMYRETYDYTGPLAAFVYKLAHLLFGRSPLAHHALSSVLIIIQASFFNYILLKSKAFDENSYLPAFLYVIAMLSIPDFMALSPQLMSMTLILIALNSVLRRIDNQQMDVLFLRSGLCVGTASMIYLPSLVFLLIFFISLVIFSSTSVRCLLLYLFGFMLIIALHMTYYYCRGDLGYFINFFFIKGLLLPAEWTISRNTFMMAGASTALVLLIAVFKTLASVRQTNFQQRVQQVIWLISLGGIGSFLLANRKSGAELIFVVPLTAYLLNHYFTALKKRFYKFLMPTLIIPGMLVYNLYFYRKLSPPDLTGQQIVDHERKALVLGENISYYANRKACSPCFSKAICEEAFNGLEYYQASTAIYKWLTKLNPDTIIDEMDIAPKLFQRFPVIEANYQQKQQGDYIKN